MGKGSRMASMRACLGAAIVFSFAGPAHAQISDTTPPHLVSVSFTPTRVDVTTATQAVTVDAIVTDDLAGTTGVVVWFTSPSSGQSQPFNGLGLSRVSGSGLNGQYRGTLQIPRFIEAGVWKLSLSLSDATGNRVFLSATHLLAVGLPTDLAVQSVGDVLPPTITDIVLSPPVIDVSSGSQNLTLYLSLADDVSGVDFSPAKSFEFRVVFTSPSGRQEQYLARPHFMMTSGSMLNGTWRATRSLPPGSEAGTWRITRLVLIDVAGNLVVFSQTHLQALGLPTTFTVLSSPADITPPQITNLTFTPPVIDTSGSFANVSVRITVSDNLSGVDFSPDTPFRSSFHGIQFRSPSGSQFRTASNTAFTLVAGTPLNGTWQASAFFPRFSEAGTWTASLFSIQDSVHNRVSLTTADLVSRGFPSQLVIFRPSTVPDGPPVGPGGGTATDTIFGNRARVMIPSSAFTELTQVAIDVLETAISPLVPIPTGYSSSNTERTFFVNIDFEPDPPMPFPAPGLTITLPFSQIQAPGQRIKLFRLEPGLGDLVPAMSVNGGNVAGVVNADGLSATFAGVSRLSTVVGLFETSVQGDVNGDRTVDCADLAAVQASFGKRTGQPGFNPAADFNRNGVIDVLDLAVVSRELPSGTTCR